jgi:hypothetical protein
MLIGLRALLDSGEGRREGGARRGRALCRFAAAVIAACVLVGVLAPPGRPDQVPVYAGVGAWLDIFAGRPWLHPEQVVAALSAEGVGTLYLETSNYSQARPIVYPTALGHYIDDAHAAGLRVVAWYLPSLTAPARDLARSLAAIRFRSPAGGRFDAFALDIEASLESKVARRNAHLLALAGAVRAAAPPGYPLGAIIPSPVGMQRHPHYWPDFPYAPLARLVDAFLPMAYFSYYTDSTAGAYTYTRGVVAAIRAKTGDPTLAIHLIGGIANRIDDGALNGFARAASDCGVDGISLYAYLQTSASQWTRLRDTQLGSPLHSHCTD